MAVNGNQGKRSQEFEIYCYKGRLKHIIHMWETVQVKFCYSKHITEFIKKKKKSVSQL